MSAGSKKKENATKNGVPDTKTLDDMHQTLKTMFLHNKKRWKEFFPKGSVKKVDGRGQYKGNRTLFSKSMLEFMMKDHKVHQEVWADHLGCSPRTLASLAKK